MCVLHARLYNEEALRLAVKKVFAYTINPHSAILSARAVIV